MKSAFSQDSQNSNTQPTLPRGLTVRQFHAAIGGIIGQETLYDYVHSGRLRAIRVGEKGGKFLILRSEVDDFFIREARGN